MEVFGRTLSHVLRGFFLLQGNQECHTPGGPACMQCHKLPPPLVSFSLNLSMIRQTQ